MPAETEPATRIRLCGRLQVEWLGTRIERELPGRQGRLLFAYLVLNRHRPIRRDELVGALWTEDELGTSPALLAPPLSRLRRVLGPDAIEGREQLRLVLPADAWIDWEAVGAGISRASAAAHADDPTAALGEARTALEIAERGLLPGLDAPWIDECRRELHGLRVEALELVAVLGARLGGPELPTAERAARAAVEASPFRESARAALIDVLRVRGNPAEALRMYEETRRLLREELGVAPGPLLAGLYRQLLDGQPVAPRAAPPPRATASAPPAAARAADLLPERLAQANLAPFVGREEQIERLAELLDRATTGEGALVLIAGEGGIGKTRLAAELAGRARPLTVLYGRCDEDESTPFGPWVEALTRHLVANPEIDVEGTLAGDGPVLARLIPELRSLVPGLSETASGDPETDRLRLFAAVASLVMRLASREPLLLVLDDLHWADRSSLILLRQIARGDALRRVLVVGTYRDNELAEGHPLSDILGDLERDRPAVRIQLGGLGTSDLTTLVSKWRGIELSGETVGALHQQTAGNPFFMKQLVSHLEELGGFEQATVDAAFGIPAGVRDVIVRRLARLPRDGDRVLKIAALIGREFDLGLLELVVDLPEDRLLDVLDAAVQAGIVSELAERPGRYSFAHALLRTTLERELTATRRSRLHRRIAEAIERLHRTHLDGYVSELARHFAAAGPDEVDRAVSYLLRAGEQAALRLAYEEAAAHIAEALALREREPHRDELEVARLTLLLADATWRAGWWEQGRDAFAAAADASRRADAPALFARASLGHAGGFERFGTPDPESADLLEEALRRLPPEDSPLRAQVLARLSDAHYYLGAPVARRHELVHAAIEMAHRLDDPESLAQALAAAQYAYWHPGGNERRLALAYELAEVSERLDDPQIEARARTWRSVALLDHCRLEEADRDIDRFAVLARKLQQPELLVHAAALRAMRALLEGRFDEGEKAALEVLGFGERSRAVDALQSYGVEMLQLRNEQLRLGELTEHYELLVREVGAIPAWRAPLAWAHVQAGRVDLARVEIDHLVRDDLAALPRDGNLVPACAILGHVAGELDDAVLAASVEPLLRPVAPHWVVLGYGPATLGPVAFTLGLASQLTGQLDQAVEDFELALDRSTRMRARPYLAHTEIRLAQVLRRRGAPGDAPRARELLARGLQTARELGMTRLVRDADRASPSDAAAAGGSSRPADARPAG